MKREEECIHAFFKYFDNCHMYYLSKIANINQVCLFKIIFSKKHNKYRLFDLCDFDRIINAVLRNTLAEFFY